VARAKLTASALGLVGAAIAAGLVLVSQRGGEAPMPIEAQATVLPARPSLDPDVPCIETVVAGPGTVVVLRARQRGSPIRGQRLARCPSARMQVPAPAGRRYHRYGLATNRRR